MAKNKRLRTEKHGTQPHVLDYTPRSAQAHCTHRKLEHVVLAAPVRKQQFPVFEVLSRGHCVEFTDSRADAHAVYAQADAPKHLLLRNDVGRPTLLEQVTR
jgi:hypothetical protein